MLLYKRIEDCNKMGFYICFKVLLFSSMVLPVVLTTLLPDTYNIHAYMYIQVSNNTITIPISLNRPLDYEEFLNRTKLVVGGNQVTTIRNDRNIMESDETAIGLFKNFEVIQGVISTSAKPNEHNDHSRCLASCERARARGFPKDSQSYTPDIAINTQPQMRNNPLRSKRHLTCRNRLEHIKNMFFLRERRFYKLECFGKTLNIRVSKVKPTTQGRFRRSIPTLKKSSYALENNSANSCNISNIAHFEHKWREMCNSWAGISYDGSKLCTYNVGCMEGLFLKGHECLESSREKSFNTICGEGDFKFSNRAVQRYPSQPKLIDEKVCYIGQFKVSSCSNSTEILQIVSIIGINQEEWVVTEPHHYNFGFDTKEILNYQCHGCTSPNCLRCDGDETYLTNFNKANPTSCHCVVSDNPRYGRLSVVINNQVIPIRYYVSQLMKVTMKLNLNSEVKMTGCLDCSVTCVANNVIFKSIDFPVQTIKICSRSNCYTTDFENKVVVPYGLLLLNRLLKISLFNDGKMVLNLTTSCEFKDTCDLISCSLCLSKILNPSCYTLLDKTLLLVVLVTTFLMLSILYRILKISLVLIDILKSIIKVLMVVVKAIFKISLRCCGKSMVKGKKIYRRIEDLSDGNTVEMQYEEPIIQVVNNKPSLKTYLLSKGVNKIFILALIFIMFSYAEACNEVTSVKVQDSDCVIRNNQNVCEIKSKILLNLGSLDSDVCLSLTTLSGLQVGTVRMKIGAIRSRCVIEDLYWTYQPDPILEQRCFCWPNSKCKEYNCFNYAFNNQNVTGLDFLHRDVTGESGCRKLMSDFGRTCIVSLEGCCYYKLSLKPASPPNPLRVRRCSSYYWEVDIKYKTFMSGSTSFGEIKAIAGQSVPFLNGYLMLTSVSQPGSVLSNDCIISDKVNNSFLAECSDNDEMIKGKLGEIRCATEVGAQTGENCRAASGITTILPRGFQIQADYNMLDILEIIHRKKLPFSNPSLVYALDKIGYYYSTKVSSAFQVQLTIPEVRIEVYGNLPSCTLSQESLTGCHSCLSGANLELRASCQFYPALGSISCPSFLFQIPFVLNQKGVVSIAVSLTKSEIHEACQFQLGKVKGDLSITGSLMTVSYNESLVNEGKVVTSSNVSGTGLKEIFNILSGILPNFFSFISLYLILGLVLGILVLKVALKMFF